MVTGGHKEGKKEGKPETVRMPVIIVIIRRLSCEDLLEREGRPLEAEERRPKSVGTIPGRTKYDQNDVIMIMMIRLAQSVGLSCSVKSGLKFFVLFVFTFRDKL